MTHTPSKRQKMYAQLAKLNRELREASDMGDMSMVNEIQSQIVQTRKDLDAALQPPYDRLIVGGDEGRIALDKHGRPVDERTGELKAGEETPVPRRPGRPRKDEVTV